jgi:hypothetical protein
MNMSVQVAGIARPRRGPRPPLLDVAAEVLVADPAASLAEVAVAAGIGRTTLHKHYATATTCSARSVTGPSTCGSRR